MTKLEYFLTYFEYDKLIAILQVIPSFLGQYLQEDIINKVITLEFPIIAPIQMFEIDDYEEYIDYEEPNVIYLDEQGIPYIF